MCNVGYQVKFFSLFCQWMLEQLFSQLPPKNVEFFCLYNNNLHICRMDCNLLRFLCQNASKDIFSWLPVMFNFFGVSVFTILGV